MPSVERALHVVTYAQFPGQAAPDVLDHKVLQKAANPKENVEGDASKALVSKTKNHQCNGDPSTGGCTICHAYAEERVISRLVDGGDSIAVVWRKYHPLAAKGRAEPGKPFEAEHDGVKIRVEAREVVEGAADLNTPKTISWLALQGLEAELKTKNATAKVREGAREAVDAFEQDVFRPVLDKLEGMRGELADLPDFPNEPTRAEVVKAARDAIMALSDQVGALEQQVLNADKPQPLVAQLTAKIAEVTPQLEAPLAPVAAFKDKHAAWATMQGELRGRLEAIEALGKWRADVVADLPGAAAAIKQQDLDGRIQAAEKALDGILAHTRKADGIGKALTGMAEFAGDAGLADKPWAEAWVATRTRADALVKALGAELDGIEGVEATKKADFAARLARLRGLSAPGSDAERHLTHQLEAGGMLAGFATKYFVTQLGEQLAKARPGLGDGLPGGAAPLDEAAREYHKPAAQKALGQAEAKLAGVDALLARASADMQKRAAGLFPRVPVGGLQVAPPSVSAVVNAVHGDKVDLTVHVRANGPEPLLVALKSPEGKVLAQVALRERGHRLSVRLQGVAPQLTPVVTAAGAAPAAAPGVGDTLALNKVELPAFPIDLAKVVGAARHVLPTTYTPSPQQPGGAQNVTFAVPDGALSALDAIPGEPIR
jgi:hypothetical protein